MRALVLAAGLGTRLRPLTDDIPKPLLPVIARPLVEHAFALLDSAGVREIALNTHHLAKQFHDAFSSGTCFGQKIVFSDEQPQVLGTGGAIKRLRARLGAEGPFVVTNGDTMSKPDLLAAICAHEASGALATMILRRDGRAARFGAVETDRAGAVLDIANLLGRKGEDSGLFIGTHVLSPDIFAHMPDEDVFCIVRQVYIPMLKKSPGAVRAVFTDGPFFDLGAPGDFARAQFEILRDPRGPFAHALRGLVQTRPGVFLSPTAVVHPRAQLVAPCAVCEGAQIGEAVVGPETVIGARAVVADGATFQHAVLMPDAAINVETASDGIYNRSGKISLDVKK